MSFKIKFETEAGKEFRKSAKWYEQQSKGLGGRFTNSVFDVLDNVKAYPQSFPIYQGCYRQAVVPNFPFVVVFKISENLITVVAVFHTHRNPDFKIR